MIYYNINYIFIVYSVLVYQIAWSQLYVPQALKNKYSLGNGGGSGAQTITKSRQIKTSYGGYNGNGYGYGDRNQKSNENYQSAINSHSYGASPYAGGSVKKTMNYKGGCTSQPVTPMNAGLTCSVYSGCKVNCMPNYQLPDGSTNMLIKCENGQWIAEGSQWNIIPSCEPICLPVCQNNGICLSPNQCNCPENFMGPQCQYESKPCLNLPSMPVNARRKCSRTSCTVTCLNGHQFSDGSTVAQMECKNGNWIPSRGKWVSLPDCQAICKPPCLNGGKCLSLNICQCSQDFRGPQCQYRSDACNPKSIEFNGAYNCTGTSDVFKCSLSCPTDIKFSFSPAEFYVCHYSIGKFEPSSIPQCVYPENVQDIHGPETSNTYYHQYSNSSDYFKKFRLNGTKFDYTNPNLFFNGSDSGFTSQNQILLLEKKLPKPGTCFSWGGSHYKTFDGKIFSFNSKCSYVLVKDAIDDTFNIIIQNAKECSTNPNLCSKVIQIYLEENKFTLKQSDKGYPIWLSSDKILPIPGELPGMRIKIEAHYVLLSLDFVGATIKWDGKNMIQVDITESLWNRTEGLCGKLDDDQTNDLVSKDEIQTKTISTFASSWKVFDLKDVCNDDPTETHGCKNMGLSSTMEFKANEFCKKLFFDTRFDECNNVVDTESILNACTWDYCSCQKTDKTECACESLSMYIRDCSLKGIKGLAKWRDEKLCPMKCTGGKVYYSCGPSKDQPVCGGVTLPTNKGTDCIEGCFCPNGTVLHENKCIVKEECPCKFRGKYFLPGSTIPKDCNTCTCSEGSWICTEVKCRARCSAIGDPHYTTFDGKTYDFMGQCNYYLVKHDNFTIEAENIACAGSISLAMNIPLSLSEGLPSCTKSVTVKYNGQKIKLKQNHEILVNGQDVLNIPYSIMDIKIKAVSSIFLKVILPNSVEVWWDGVTRVYIDAPPTLQGQTKGLCGNFSNNQKDDFLTPENDIEQSVIAFANKWKTSEKCNDVPEKLFLNPCEKNAQRKNNAEKHCSVLKSNLFGDCHVYVDPEQFYQNCLYDMCSCETQIKMCLCPIISAFAMECSRRNIKVDWRTNVKECGIQCSGGQKYQVCGNSCTRTCSDISFEPECKQECVEGCNCLEGETLDKNGDCIPIGRCKCQYNGIDYPAGYKEIRPASKALELCTCINANWICKPATPMELNDFPQAADIKSKCNSTANMEFTTCEPVEPITCKNMHDSEYFTTSVCHSGCKCKKGFVLDTKNKICVKPEHCPCHHGGRSYKEKSIVQNDCNTCTCKNGKWKCTNRQCIAECSAWGDSHYKTFDGKHFDFQGQCDYLLAKGLLGFDESFDISTQNVPCGSLGTSCSKSLTVKINSGGDEEIIKLTKKIDFLSYKDFKHLTFRNSGLFVIVEAVDLGLSVHWDKGTRVYVKLTPRWKNKVKGLCGNYNDNEVDDFQTPSGGMTEVSPKIFGDSWKLQSYCSDALDINDTCSERPDRRVWAHRKCGVLKSSVFAACHSEVPLESFLKKCIFDACACDQGGDCKCLCTALAAYAQECNNRGIPIKWRSQNLCPIQCDERCSNYSPCISTCPIETCDNLLSQSQFSKLCAEETCVEGCSFKLCPPGYVYFNSSHLECVLRSSCKPICLEENGITYYEGDLLNEDECHSCFCSRGKKICTGQPCHTTILPDLTSPQMEQMTQCSPGWTDWINRNKKKQVKPKSKNELNEIEHIPSSLFMNSLKGAKCSYSQMANIECRTMDTKVLSKKTGLDVECSLEKGLVCKGTKDRKCPDFEIRILCECDYIEHPPPTTKGIPICDVSIPHQENPTDCHLFYHCVFGDDNAPKLIEKSCGRDMMYNPKTMSCDWPANVVLLKSSCQLKKEEESRNETVPECPPGMVMEKCAIPCENVCLYYSFILNVQDFCKHGVKCEAGCISLKKKVHCPKEKYWANNETCVSRSDCMCTSLTGRPVKPGQVVEEKGCKQCQCIDNYYSCHKVQCSDEVMEEMDVDEYEQTEEPTEEDGLNRTDIGRFEYNKQSIVRTYTIPPILIIPSTVTPPEACTENRHIYLIQGDQPLPDEAFTASSILSSLFSPSNARLNSEITESSGGNWAPEFSNEDQYLQIDLGRLEPIYGVVVRGSPLYDEYVTSYKVLYSSDGNTFYYVLNEEKRPEIFRGSIDQTTPVKEIFDVPFEAQKIRINPQTWNNGISLRVELIGCGEPISTTTESFEFITAQPTIKSVFICDDEMGYGDNKMSEYQVFTSSDLSTNHSKKYLKLTGTKSWQPLSNTPTEWVMFDFLEPRNITGLVTRGGDNGWVKSYKVYYSENKIEWNPILDKNLKEVTFLGNLDNQSPHKNYFERPIQSRYVKITPSAWNENIQLRVEMHGCFKEYPLIDIPLTTVSPFTCNTCPEIMELELDACKCSNMLWWNGKNCVNRTQCPCTVGHMHYSIGALFLEEDCMECVCKIGGIKHCTLKKCDSCSEGLKSTLTSTCQCTCKTCPDNTILCPTSNICVNETLWCNGVQDCPDDEINCPTTAATEIPTTTKKPKICPVTKCLPGFETVEIINNKNKFISPMLSRDETYVKKSVYQGLYNGVKTGGIKGKYKNHFKRPNKETVQIEEVVCKEYKCVSTKLPPKFIHTKEECPPITCQPSYIAVFDIKQTLNNDCPKYSCHPPPPPDAICNITGRTFNTFDNTEYKFDICNHVIARDLDNDDWEVALKKNCSKYCSRTLVIRHNDNVLSIHSDLSLELDGFSYSVAHIQKIVEKLSEFSIQRVGNVISFESNKYGFWVIWNKHGNVKLGVVNKLMEKVDGLCGYFNSLPKDDKRKPDGSVARTTEDFGESWAVSNDQPKICEAKTCKIHIQNKAWEMCNSVKARSLSPCAKVVDIDNFISRCLETTCNCLDEHEGNYTAEEECRCQTIQNFVIDCLGSDSLIDINDWRMQHNCPITCDYPLVYHDCYQRKCEPTCKSISDPNVCPKISNMCFPGCYCPAGYVRKENTCIKPSNCRDCECNVLPHLQYITYDESNFTVTGNCVYVMSRDIFNDNDKHNFQVLVTNHPCTKNNKKMCIGKITILYKGHKIHIFMDNYRHKLKLIVDAERINDFEEISEWLSVRETSSKHFKILMTEMQVEVSVYFPSLGVSVKAPSHKYGGKLEGLCGNCNGDPSDDNIIPNNKKAINENELALGWLYDKLPGGQLPEQCGNIEKLECQPLPNDKNPCLQLIDVNKFGQCLPILDPSLFIDWCQKDTCGGYPELSCTAIEAYARDCAGAGFCINWRTNLCPAKSCSEGQLYNPCGSSCPKTCKSIEIHKPSVCKSVPVEGCFCPKGKVLLNNTCVSPNDCKVCDDEGHHPGDIWKKDNCTTCTCEGTSLKCETQSCTGSTTICEKGYNAKKIPSKENQCCDKFVCVPEPVAGPTCEPPQEISCGPGQVLKLDTKPNGCRAFICQCKPAKECDKIDLTKFEKLDVGYKLEIDENGCCPLASIVCRQELCSEAKPCPQYYRLESKEIPGKCCPIHTCEPPQEMCIFEAKYISATDGGERLLTKFEKRLELKAGNSSWNDGPCRVCNCLLTSSGSYQFTCKKEDCKELKTFTDFYEYDLVMEHIYDKCCPEPKRIGCKHKGQVYKVQESWPLDKCSTMKCTENSNKIIKETLQITCDSNCEFGHEYIETNNENECCGVCKPIGCVANQKIFKIGENWTSDDYCIEYSCKKINESMQIHSLEVNCLKLKEDFISNFEFSTRTEDGKCCKKYEATACKEGLAIYKVGDTWPSPDGNKCKNITCVRKTNGELSKQESFETCTKDCEKGWEYMKSSTGCCGKCKQVACVLDNITKYAGENWTSTDNCTTYSCEAIEDQLLVSTRQQTCPSIKDCPKENVYNKGCCQYCNISVESQSTCSPQIIALNKTIGIIKHKTCTNKHPIKDFSECVGYCQSSTLYNYISGMHESVCSCCQATGFNTIEVELLCDNGSIHRKKIAVPSKCGCENCVNNFSIKTELFNGKN